MTEENLSQSSIESQKLSEELVKLKLENAILRKSPWRTPTFILTAAGLILSLSGNIQQFISARVAIQEAKLQFDLVKEKWLTEKAKMDAETQNLKGDASLKSAQYEQTLAKQTPIFTINYVSMSMSAYDQLMRSEDARIPNKKPFSPFPGLRLYRNALHNSISKDEDLQPDFTNCEFHGGGNLDYFKNLAQKRELPVERKVTCAIIRLEGNRSVRNTWISAFQIQIPGAASLPQELYSPTNLLLDTFKDIAKPIRIGLGDIEPGRGYIIPLFIAITDFQSRIAYGNSYIPQVIHFEDSGQKLKNETTQTLRAMEPSPFMIEGGVEHSG